MEYYKSVYSRISGFTASNKWNFVLTLLMLCKYFSIILNKVSYQLINADVRPKFTASLI